MCDGAWSVTKTLSLLSVGKAHVTPASATASVTMGETRRRPRIRLESVYVRSEHTIRGMPRPDCDLERTAPLEVEVLRDDCLRRALRCDIDHQHPRAAHVPERLLPRMQQLLGRRLPE